MLPILGRRECEHKSQWTSIQSLVPHNIVSFLNPFQNFHVQKLNKTKTCLPFQNNYVLKSNKTRYFYFLKSCDLPYCLFGLVVFFFFFVWGFSAFSQICGKSNYIPTLSKVNTAAEKLGSQNIVSLKYWGLDQFLSQKTTGTFNPIYFSRVDPPADELVQRHRWASCQCLNSLRNVWDNKRIILEE